MLQSLRKISFAAASAAALTLAGVTGAQAALTVGATPAADMPNPTPTASTAGYLDNVIGSIPFTATTAWAGTALEATGMYSSVEAGGSATFEFVPSNTVSFLWGSPDDYNDLVFKLGGVEVAAFTGDDVEAPASGAGQKFVTISGIGKFDSVTFLSSRNAFEFANFEVAAVPLPAGGLLLITALGGAVALRRRKSVAA